MKNILFLGNTPTYDKRSIGGATVYTKNILDELKKDKNLNIELLVTRKRWYKLGQLIDFTLLVFRLPFYLKGKSAVSIHASWDFHVTIGPIICLICRIFKVKIIYHFFGGNFHTQYETFPFPLRLWLKSTILSSDFKLMETKKMISFFESKVSSSNFVWFPNSRKRIKMDSPSYNYGHRLVFISRVTKTKGIDLLMEVSNKLPEHYILDAYGPLDDKYYQKEDFDKYRLNYLGVLEPSEVIDKLFEYDILVLPTYYKGEGYPGILIEALLAGKPIISTKLNALDEIVVSGYNGLLIEQKSTNQLLDSILHFNNDNYESYVKNSFEKSKDFDFELVIDKLKSLY